MSDPQPAVPNPGSPTGGERRRLDRAPGDRYAGTGTGRGPGAGPGEGGGARRALVAGVLVADAAAVGFFLLGLLDLGVGLLALAAFIGWIVALALVWWGRGAIPVARTRVAYAALLGGWAIVAAVILDWIYALVQGGVLGPLDYVAQRYGIVGMLSVLVAAAVAALRAR
jgi:hypothetical protein